MAHKREILSILYPAKKYSTAEAKRHGSHVAEKSGLHVVKAKHIGNYIHVKLNSKRGKRKIRTFTLGKGIIAHYAVPPTSRYLRKKSKKSRARKVSNPHILGLPDFWGDVVLSTMIAVGVGYYFHRLSQKEVAKQYVPVGLVATNQAQPGVYY